MVSTYIGIIKNEVIPLQQQDGPEMIIVSEGSRKEQGKYHHLYVESKMIQTYFQDSQTWKTNLWRPQWTGVERGQG